MASATVSDRTLPRAVRTATGGAGVADLGDLGVLVNLDAQLRGRPGPLVGEPGGAQGAAAVPVPGQNSGLSISARTWSWVSSRDRPWPVQLVGLHRHGEHSGAFELAVQAELGHVRREPVQVARQRVPARPIVGQRLRPLAAPWVRLASQNPPLRPDAAQPICWPSSRTPGRPGCGAWPHRGPEPGVPPPTTVRSAVAWPTSGSNRGAGALSCSQNTSRRLPTNAASTRAGDGALSS